MTMRSEHRAAQPVVAPLAALAAALVAVAACARHAAPADATPPAAASGRSSATQVVEFTAAERSRYSRVELMIANRFAGVTVVPAGNTYTITIRGAGTFGGSSNEPLVIIDGAHRSTADLRGVDPRDVVRIEIVKDAASSYGVRAANGVIVVTTRAARPDHEGRA